jgi:O-antigen ligase
MDLEKLDNWCERAILGLVLSILIYSPLALGATHPHEFVFSGWLMLAVLAVWLVRFWINPKHRLLWPPVCWAVLAFLGYAVARWLTADIEYVARQELFKVVVYVFLFLAVLHNLHRQETTQFVGLTIVFLGMAIALYAIFQFAADWKTIWHLPKPPMYLRRGSGTFYCPNHLAGYLAMILPLAIAYTLTGRFKYVTKILLGYAALVLFGGLLVSVSRGAWVASGLSLVGLFFWLMQQRDYRLQGIILAAALLALTAVFVTRAQLSPDRTQRLSTLVQTDDIRLKLWPPSVAMWKDHALLGVGPGHFDYRFRQYRPADWDMQWRPLHPHNDYLGTLAEWGLVGAVLLGAGWVLFYGGVFRSWKYVVRAQNDFAAKRSNKSSFVMGGALGLLAVLLHSMVDFDLRIPASALLAATLLALVTGFFRFATEQHWHTLRGPGRPAVTAVLLAAMAFLAAQSWRQTREQFRLAAAAELPSCSPEQIAALKKAFEAEPKNFETAYEIGEAYRLQSWQGLEDYRALAESALQWFERSMTLNAYYPYSIVRHAMCLDWLGRHREAGEYFERAVKIDPHGYFTLAHVGWHHVQLEEWAAARDWLLKSVALRSANNPVANYYLDFVNRKLAEKSAPDPAR